MIRRTTVAVAASIVAHALVCSIGIEEAKRHDDAALTLSAPASSAIAALASVAERSVRIEGERRALLTSARAALAEGHLELGAFLLRANALDAAEQGLPFDQAETSALYADRVRALRGALAGADVVHAVPEVFGDLRYRGEPGGFMGSALVEGSGSCEQIAQLVAAAVFDAGAPDAIALRFYGKPTPDGIAHVAPIAVAGGDEHDLMSGRPAIRRGARISASDLVEVYARAHGLAPPLAGSGAGGASTKTGGTSAQRDDAEPGSNPPPAARPSLIAGFPPNDDRYPSALPLYAARAVKEPSDDSSPIDEEGDSNDRARDCAYTVRLATLNPPLIEVQTNPVEATGVALEPHRQPKTSQLERKASILRAAETLTTDPSSDAADRIMGWACLAALGGSAAVDFELAGERRFADAAIDKRRAGREEGSKALASIQWSSDEGERLRRRLSEDYGGRSWLVLALPGGDDVLLRLLERGKERDDWGRVGSLAALVLWPATEERALDLVEGLPIREQVDVMHEIFHAHDHMRPWATNVDLGDAPSRGASGASFRRVYRVFRGLAFRLWEGQRPISEVIDALFREAKAAGIGQAWEAALIDYCAKNALGLYSLRAAGMDVVRTLKEAVHRCGHPSLAVLDRQLTYIEAQSTLSARTLADAMRMP